jgi:beta-aspartyl-peptidase (threonine type)
MISESSKSQTIAIIVHGGAYDIPREVHQAHLEGCRKASEMGWKVLKRGGTAVEATETAVRTMEDDPTFDAGYGSFLNAAGEVEMDAIIMDGSDLNMGAVAAVQGIRNPITLAKLVMTETNHTMIVGAGAQAFAIKQNLPISSPEELLVGRELERYRTALKSGRPQDWDPFGAPPPNKLPSDTVGAVALDVNGNLSAATSTGGTFNKLPGRVGDSPLVGSGAYADNRSGGVSATGLGEALMKIVISKTTCDFIAGGMSAQEAAHASIALLSERTDGEGGVIVLDQLGRVGVAHSSPYIAHAFITGKGEAAASIMHP